MLDPVEMLITRCVHFLIVETNRTPGQRGEVEPGPTSTLRRTGADAG